MVTTEEDKVRNLWEVLDIFVLLKKTQTKQQQQKKQSAKTLRLGEVPRQGRKTQDD